MILRLRPEFTQEDARPDSLIQTSQKGLRLQIQQILTIWLYFNKDFIWKNETWNLQILWFTEGPYFWGSLLAFDAWFWRYLSCQDALLEAIAFLRCLSVTLFVVAGGTFGSHCLPSMLDFDAICCARMHFWRFVLASMIDFRAICGSRMYFCKSLLGVAVFSFLLGLCGS